MPRWSGTALLCLIVFCNTFSVGAFGPLLPEIARAQQLADWQLGLLAGAFGFARMAADLPSGMLAGRRLGTTLVASPVVLLGGVLLLASAGPLPVLVGGRFLIGLAHTLGMVGGLTALLQEDRGAGASLRLNTFEFAGMLGILGGLAVVAIVPAGWAWNVSLLVACAPQLLVLAALPQIRRRFPDRAAGPVAGQAPRAVESRAPRPPDSLVWMMCAFGAVIALAWSSVSQFIIPLRGAREFSLDRAGVSSMLAIAQLVDLVVLLPVGWLADRVGRHAVLGAVGLVLGLGTAGVGLGSFPWFVAGCAGFGLGLAGWMLPLGIIRQHTGPEGLAWRTGVYRVGVDAAIFLGPLLSGLVGESRAGIFVALIGAAAVAFGVRLLSRPPT